MEANNIVRAMVLEELNYPLIEGSSHTYLRSFESLIKVQVCGVCRIDLLTPGSD